MMKRVFSVAVMLCILAMAGNVWGSPGCFVLTDVSGGEYHTLATTEENTLWACGSNSDKQLGLGSTVSSTSVLQQVPGEDGVGFLEDILDFDAGWYHSLANDINGNIWAWGTDSNGQLGNGAAGSSYFPERVLGVGGAGLLENIATVSAGRSGVHSLAADSDGYVYAWGSNAAGQCGNGTSGGTEQTPVRVLDDDPGTNGLYLGDVAFIIAVDAGVSHSIALDDDGYVWQWGSLSTTGTYPEKVKGEGGAGYLENIIAISSCESNIALDENGNVWTWESGYPEKVQGGGMQTQYLENIVAVGAGDEYKMALDSDGYVWQWDNLPVKVADGQMQTSSGYLENISVIDAGYEHKLTIDKNGTGWAWGYGASGVLGDGGNSNQTAPVEMLLPSLNANISVSKVDDVYESDDPNCVVPDDEIIYTITVGPNGYDHEWVTVTDYLPVGISYDPLDLATMTVDPNYDEGLHTYTWQLGPLNSTDDPVVLNLTVTVNELAEPCGTLINDVTVKSNITCQTATNSTPVCDWGGDIIFVDFDKPSGGSGTSWAAAHNHLNAALARAANGCGNEIWVAAGIDSPGGDVDDSFVLPDGVEVYGGFAGNETSRDQRDWIANKTVLSGSLVNNYTVKMGDNCLLDGFVVENAFKNGIYGDGVDFELVNCVIEDNLEDGIRALYGNLTVEYCTIRNNGKDGVYNSENGNTVIIENCKIYSNAESGVNCYKSTPTVLNSEVYYNGNSGDYYGIKFIAPSSSPEIRNCTIVNNANEGIYRSGGSSADVVNCIVRDNNGNDIQWEGIAEVYNCCFTDPNDLTGTDEPDVNNNITCAPGFAYQDIFGNYHLASDSVCIDKGDSTDVATGETDIDGQDRIYTTVDIGADEVTACSDVSRIWVDADGDGLVNYVEFAAFANSWGMTQNDPNWSDTHVNYDYVDSGEIDIADLRVLRKTTPPQVWCWTACWLEGNGSVYDIWLTPIAAAQQSSSMMMPMSIGMESTAVETQPVEHLSSDEIIDFFELLFDDKDAMEVINKKDLKEFIKSLESDLFTDLP